MGMLLRIPSDLTNVINTIIFEIVLITLIFFLTADVCARLNYVALRDGSVQDLVVISPPLVGGGVISTTRKRTFIMIALRSLGIILIFGTALTIDGGTSDVPLTVTKQVRSPADLSNMNTTKNDVLKLVNLRFTCVVNSNNSAVFGRLDVDGHCETHPRLLENAISIRPGVESISVSFSRGCRHRITRIRTSRDSSGSISYVLEYVITFCEQDGRKASVLCFRKRSGAVIDFSICMASFKLNTTKFAVCDEFEQVLAGPSISINASCHSAANLDTVQDFWPKATEISHSQSIFDMIGAVSVVGTQEREVKKYERRDVTKVDNMWFLCLAVKLMLLVSLGILSIYLRCKKTKRVLNDDRALLDLLRQRLDDWIGVCNPQEPPTIYLHLRTNEEGERNVWASTTPNYNVAVNNPEAEA